MRLVALPLLMAFVMTAKQSLSGPSTPCLKILSEKISDVVENGRPIAKFGVVFNKVDYFEHKNTTRGCVCNLKTCVRKCCPPGQIILTNKCAKRPSNFALTAHDGTDPIATLPNFHFIYNQYCKFGKTLLMPHVDEYDSFFVQRNGSLYLPNFEGEKVYEVHNYCVDVFENRRFEMNGTVSALICNLDDVEDDVNPDFYSVGMIVSMPFLLATFVVYALLPDRNLHMKALMSYVINLFGGYLLLVCIQLSKLKFSYPTCVMLGYLCLFFFMVSFFWMNVICIDIWFAFSGLRGFSGTKNAERRRFLFYCLYAWGMSIVHVLTVFTIDKLANRKSWYYPSIGNGQCFLQLGWAELLYFYGPMGTLITINIILFAITAIRIRKLRQETSMLKKDDNKRHTYENDKQKFNLYLKLLFAMGVNWSMELISWAVTWRVGHVPPYIWYLTDFCNAIYGVFIFFIFVFKRSIWKLLKKRYYSFIGKPYLAHSMTQNQTSRVTSYSTANTSVPEEHPQSHGESIAMTEA